MNFADFSNEFIDQLIAANTKEEITKLLEDAGFEFTQEDVETICAKVTGERSGISILSEDEMDAVAGGADRNANSDGCASTVDNTWCWTNDSCSSWYVTYDWKIICNKSTETPPKHRWQKFTRNFDPNDYYYMCMNCGLRYWTKEMPEP